MQGSLGIEIARLHQPDLILLDLHLPDLSGDEVLERLKTDETTSAIPVVIVSADANRDTLKRLEEAGASSFVTKPVNVQLFLETVDEMLAQD
jgi:CheY-like chemotaxis protein